MTKSVPKSVDQYISTFPKETQSVLEEIRTTILKAAPQAEEGINYGMPSYKLNGKPLVYFGGYENHIGFYATPTGHSQFAKALSKYKQGKGSVQFPLSQPMPFALIAKMVKFKIRENLNNLKK